MSEKVKMDARKPATCASCQQKTENLSEVVNPQAPQETMWVCDRCVRQHNYMLAAYAKAKAEQQ
ncbi:hypothetical protein EPA93_11745 [Ktedonosporobacter rubrisoli]|uniref:ClpX-type ZB domain-containing protein n=1 Tax=Ktedonosporobacter rubrisoli TaxID=2509675 RepID=A0A4P6JMX2_KTERU|nr:hypothetical protein [Ktedonosporobacter rubrisoli]QBD76638.1 hypothetical protein EPA93_11745 [Ktedonosporobacter rubrisoli]